MPFDQVKTQVLLLHSEQAILDTLSSGFDDQYTVHCATSGSEALNTLGDTPIHVILSAQKLPGMSGVEALREAKKRSPDTIGILLVGQDESEIEALVGNKEVFQVVRGGISAEDVSKLVDNATQTMRLLALAESANDNAANPDLHAAEHIVMETSENGSAIISDGTGTFPILDPSKVSAAVSAGAQAVDILVFTRDEEFLTTMREAARGLHNIRHADTLAQAEQALSKYDVGVSVVDAAMIGDNVDRLTSHLRKKSKRLVHIVAGRRDDGEMLMDLINRGKLYRFLLKPVSPGRARLAVEASVKHHLEAPDAAFKSRAMAKVAAPKPAPKAKSKPATKAKPKPVTKAKPKPVTKAKPKPATKAKSKAAPKAKLKPAHKAKPKPAPKAKPAAQAKPKRRPAQINPPSKTDRLAGAFDGGATSFIDMIGGIFARIGKKIRVHKANKAVKALQAMKSSQAMKKTQAMIKNKALKKTQAIIKSQALRSSQSMRSSQAMKATMRAGRTRRSSFSKAKLFGAGAVAVIAALAVGVWKSGGIENIAIAWEAIASRVKITESDPVYDTPGDSNARANVAAKAKRQAEKIDMAIAYVEAAMLDRRTNDAAVALASVAGADPANSRIPFLMSQLSQLQLHEFVNVARTAIRDARLEDAANAIHGARSLEIPDKTTLNAVANELATARGAQRVDDVLVKADMRLNRGDLISPANDNARYFYELVLSNDPGNRSAEQGLTAIARQLVLRAHAEIESNRLISAKYLLDDARRLNPSSAKLGLAMTALADAEKRIAEQNRPQDGEARQTAVPNNELVVLTARLDDSDSRAPEYVVDAELQALTEQLAFDTSLRNDQDLQDILTLSPAPQASQALYSLGEPVSISALTRTAYVAPKYPRSAERRSLSGWVDLVFTVDTDGTTKDIEVRNSEPGQTFDRAAKKAIEKWKFMPVFENGIVVEKRAGVRMMFALE